MLRLRNQPGDGELGHGHGGSRGARRRHALNGLATLSIAGLAVGLLLEAWRSTGG